MLRRYSTQYEIVNGSVDGRSSSSVRSPAMNTATVIPVLVYDDIAAGHDYLVDVFGFTSGGLQRLDDGEVVHGEVSLGDAVIWLHRVSPEHEMDSPRRLTASHAGLSVKIADLDAH